MTDTHMIHPAWTIGFDALVAGLEQARSEKAIYARHNAAGLELWNYTDKCVYDKLWTPITISARGLILDRSAGRIVATPFPKFFNLGERQDSIPDMPFHVYEKVDGSLIIIFHHDGKWQTSTRGAFDTSQALWAQHVLAGLDMSVLEPGTTYLAEAVYADNRIVVSYEQEELVLLSGYRHGGHELSYTDIAETAARLGTRVAKRHAFSSITDIVEQAALLPRSEEGYILHFANGHRLKIKGAEYRRIHALISRVTPLAIWEMLAAGDDLDTIRREIPEELWRDFDDIRAILESAAQTLLHKVRQQGEQMQHLSDKDVGLQLDNLEQDVRKFMFPFRKFGQAFAEHPKFRETFWRYFRPTGNELAGYEPSHSMSRILEEAF